MTTFKRSDPLPFKFEVKRSIVYPAKFVGKSLILASDCPIHPKYQALRPPRSKKAGCVCAEIYQQQEERG